MRLFAVTCVVSIMFSAMSASAFADSFRCSNGNIVSTGDKISTAAAKCTSPDGIFKRTEPVEMVTGNNWDSAKPLKKIIYIEVEEWNYTKDSNLLHTLVFRNGVLSEVITGGFVR